VVAILAEEVYLVIGRAQWKQLVNGVVDAVVWPGDGWQFEVVGFLDGHVGVLIFALAIEVLSDLRLVGAFLVTVDVQQRLLCLLLHPLLDPLVLLSSVSGWVFERRCGGRGEEGV
jgi:hypothetical protein